MMPLISLSVFADIVVSHESSLWGMSQVRLNLKFFKYGLDMYHDTWPGLYQKTTSALTLLSNSA